MILIAAILAHVLLLLLVGGWIIFRSESPSTDNTGVAFGQASLPARAVTDQSTDAVKSTPPALPPPNLVPVPEPPHTTPIVMPSSYSTPTTFDVPAPDVKIPGLYETIHENSTPARRSNPNAGEASQQGAQGPPMDNLFGMDVSRDGPVVVFLDTSDNLKSLQDTDAVTKEIKKQLPTCTIQEIKGAVFGTRESLERMKGKPDLSEEAFNYDLGLVDGSIILRITAQIQGNKLVGPMTIYYYSNFKDYVDENDVNRFSKLLQDNRIHFFAHSVEKEPDEAIKRLCRDTGGNWNRWYLKGLTTETPAAH